MGSGGEGRWRDNGDSLRQLSVAIRMNLLKALKFERTLLVSSLIYSRHCIKCIPETEIKINCRKCLRARDFAPLQVAL